jgi:iron complex transport system ATP-binding protein
MSNFIEFRKVSVMRNSRKILDDISVNIGCEENVVLMGPNGSGKSTFIKLIIGEIYPSYTGDDIIFKVFERVRWDIRDLRSRLGIVNSELKHCFHNKVNGLEVVLSGFFSSFGIFGNHIIKKAMVKKAESVIDFLEVSSLKYRKFKTMSSGEVKRFLIARALVNSPKILILDEPSNNLDIASSIKLHKTIRKILNFGTKILLVTHSVSDVVPEIDRFIFFKSGRIFADGERGIFFNSDKLSSLFGIKIILNENSGLCNIAMV